MLKKVQFHSPCLHMKDPNLQYSFKILTTPIPISNFKYLTKTWFYNSETKS